MMCNNSHVLVSCFVLCYNSEATILETLDSIKSQTYDNIELIISDDCSTDNTISLCEEWLRSNKERFRRVCLLTVKQNTGVCANLNRVIEACRGEWQKGIAGDDVLLPNCVADFVEYINNHPEARWVSSYIRMYKDVIDEHSCIGRNLIISKEFFDKDVNEQLYQMVKQCVLYAPSLFYNVQMVKELGCYDVSFIAEDHPFYVKTLEHGFKCYLMPRETVGYRIHDSLSNRTNTLFNYPFKKQMREFRRQRCFKYLSKREIWGLNSIWKLEDVIEKLKLNKNNTFMSFVYRGIKGVIIRVSKVYW